jgi:hypothetical protein
LESGSEAADSITALDNRGSLGAGAGANLCAKAGTCIESTAGKKVIVEALVILLTSIFLGGWSKTSEW